MQATLTLDRDKATGGNQVASKGSTNKKLKHNTKKAKMLKTFITLGDAGINCFEAANRYSDYVLRTTVSELQRDFEVIIQRKYEQVPNNFGTKTDCMRYWMDHDNRLKAMAYFANEEVF